MKTTALAHQGAERTVSSLLESRGLFWEMGTGKTWVTLATAEDLFNTGKIDGMLVIAPNGVHTNWVTDEIPAHFPDEKIRKCVAYSTAGSRTRASKLGVRQVCTPGDGLNVLAISYSAMMTKIGQQTVIKFVKSHKCLIVLDEATRIKTPSAQRTKFATKLGRMAEYRRALTGTPVTNSPFDIYTIVRFLDPTFWKRNGFGTLAGFKRYFAIWDDGYNRHTGRSYKQLVGYRHLDELRDLLAQVGSRVMKDDVLDLPDKIFTKLYVDATNPVWDAYHELKDESIAFFDGGGMVSTTTVLTLMLRLQQITCGFVKTDDGNMVDIMPLKNPRIGVLKNYLKDIQGKVIIWARFTRDIDNIMAMLSSLSMTAVRYDGSTSDADRLAARRSFQDPDGARFFVGNPQACATGLTLTAASTVIYYSNNFRLEDRLQSEDRAHRIGQRSPVVYVDMVMRGTVDEHIVKSLREHKSIADLVNGDNVKGWI